MTNQIAPSLATELEQAAREYAEEATENRMLENTARELGGGTSEWQWKADEAEKTAALLTRAAALARAAEKVTNFDPIEADFDNQVNYCPFCGVIFGMDAPFKHLGGCVWAELRALVASEGGK